MHSALTCALAYPLGSHHMIRMEIALGSMISGSSRDGQDVPDIDQEVIVRLNKVNRRLEADEVHLSGRYTRLADSGAREVRPNGFIREPEGPKPDYTRKIGARGLDLVPDEMIERIAEHFFQGGLKYEPDNWRRGTDPDSLERYRRSAARHFVDWINGKTDEDHAAAATWNMFIYEINLRESRRLMDEQDVLTVVAGVRVTPEEPKLTAYERGEFGPRPTLADFRAEEED